MPRWSTAALLSGLDLVCPYPHQVVSGVLQNLVQPLLRVVWLSFLPCAWPKTPPSMLSAGNGQLLAVRRDAYFRAGGPCRGEDQVLGSGAGPAVSNARVTARDG